MKKTIDNLTIEDSNDILKICIYSNFKNYTLWHYYGLLSNILIISVFLFFPLYKLLTDSINLVVNNYTLAIIAVIFILIYCGSLLIFLINRTVFMLRGKEIIIYNKSDSHINIYRQGLTKLNEVKFKVEDIFLRKTSTKWFNSDNSGTRLDTLYGISGGSILLYSKNKSENIGTFLSEKNQIILYNKMRKKA